MVVPKRQNIWELLKNELLNNVEQKWYFSEKYSKIEEKVKKSLKEQKTDEALNDITVWVWFYEVQMYIMRYL